MQISHNFVQLMITIQTIVVVFISQTLLNSNAHFSRAERVHGSQHSGPDLVPNRYPDQAWGGIQSKFWSICECGFLKVRVLCGKIRHGIMEYHQWAFHNEFHKYNLMPLSSVAVHYLRAGCLELDNPVERLTTADWELPEYTGINHYQS